jgi:hypothetical protein
MTLPNLFVAGVPKAATTSLADVFRSSSDFYVPGEKEPHYYAFPEAPPSYCGPSDKEIFAKMILHKKSEYEALYSTAESKWRVDASTMYMYLASAIPNILRDNPDAKFIFIFRDPAERAFSAYQHMRRDAREPLNSFRDALEAEAERVVLGWSPIWHYANASRYGEQMERIKNNLDPANYLVLHQEWIRECPNIFEGVLENFLGCEFNIEAMRASSSNLSGEPRYKVAAKFMSRPSAIKKVIRNLLGDNISRRIKATVRQANIKERHVLSANDREFLYKKLEPDMKNFLAGVDPQYLPCWTERFRD